jgi:[ribosomal protein S5]-alanine N-acetyltransferase
VFDAPTVTAGRLRLEAFEPRHISARYIGWLNDKQVVRFSRQRLQSHSEADCSRFLASFKGSPNYFWAIVLTDGDVHIGNITVDVEPHDRVAAVNILVGETAHWGKGYGSEAFAAACEHLLGAANMRKVYAGTMATNTPMLRLMQKSGLVEEARFRGHFFWEGQAIDKVFAARFQAS